MGDGGFYLCWHRNQRGFEIEVEENEGDFDGDVARVAVRDDEAQIAGGAYDDVVEWGGGVPEVIPGGGIKDDGEVAGYALAEILGQVDARGGGARHNHDGARAGAELCVELVRSEVAKWLPGEDADVAGAIGEKGAATGLDAEEEVPQEDGGPVTYWPNVEHADGADDARLLIPAEGKGPLLAGDCAADVQAEGAGADNGGCLEVLLFACRCAPVARERVKDGWHCKESRPGSVLLPVRQASLESDHLHNLRVKAEAVGV